MLRYLADLELPKLRKLMNVQEYWLLEIVRIGELPFFRYRLEELKSFLCS